jgi:hypothetical protein
MMDWTLERPKAPDELPPAGEKTAAVRSKHYTAIINISDSPDDATEESLRRLVRMARMVRNYLKAPVPSDRPMVRDFYRVQGHGDADLYFPITPGLESTDADYLLRFLWQHQKLQIPGLKNIGLRIQ